MKSFWYTPRQAAALMSEITGQAVLPEEIPEFLTADELAGSIGGIPLMQGKTYGPMAVRAVHAKVLKERQSFLMEDQHTTMPPVVLSHYAKGGTGKTTGLVNAAIALAQRGLRVLFIDGDPQSSATMLFGVDTEDPNIRTLCDVVFEPHKGAKALPLEDALVPILDNGVLDLVPSDTTLINFDKMAFSDGPASYKRFANMLKNNAKTVAKYDIVLVDSNPHTGSPLTFILAYRADAIVMSISMDKLSMKSRPVMANLFHQLSEVDAPPKQTLVLANAFSSTSMHGQQSLSDLVANDSEMLLSTVIPFSNAVAKQGWERKEGGGFSLVEREPTSAVSKRLVRFALELSELTIWTPRQMNVLEFQAPEIGAIQDALAQNETADLAE